MIKILKTVKNALKKRIKMIDKNYKNYVNKF